MTICVLDDASTDGTGDMLRQQFPEVVVLFGDGKLFWGGGMEVGMKEAFARGAEVVVWLNDDCLPNEGALEKLVMRVMRTKGICGGVCYESSTGDVTYSGYVKARHSMHRVTPMGEDMMSADMLSGNLVAIHREVLERLGPINAKDFQHYYADAWYTNKAKLAGFQVEIHPRAKAINEPSNYFDRIGVDQSAWDAWRNLFRRGSAINVSEQWKFLSSVSLKLALITILKRFLVMIKYVMVAVKRGGLRALYSTKSERY